MADDLCNDCDCGDCDLDCCDCDCTCDDCFPGSNVFLFFLCIPPTKTNGGSKDASSDCCCFCCHGRRSSPPRQNGKRRKKKGCCWRLCCCFARNDPSPPPSPPRPRPDGRYPMSEDLDLYMNDRWGRRHETDMPPMGYKSGMKYPVPEEMRMYRDKYYGHGGRWDQSRDKRNDYRSNERYAIRNEMLPPNENEKAASDERNITHQVKNVSFDLIKGNKDKLEIGQHESVKDQNSRSHGQLDYERGDDQRKNDYRTPHQDQMLPSRWSTPKKYEES